jgi:hypothetical protein
MEVMRVCLNYIPIFSVLHATQAFLAVVVIGTGWKLLGMYAARSQNTQLQHLGLAMLFQYV